MEDKPVGSLPAPEDMVVSVTDVDGDKARGIIVDGAKEPKTSRRRFFQHICWKTVLFQAVWEALLQVGPPRRTCPVHYRRRKRHWHSTMQGLRML